MPTLGVFAAITDKEHRILCVRINYGTRGWTTPGGRVEPGESPVDALKREVLEESGLDVIVEELVGVYAKPRQDDIVLFFRARVIAHHPWQPNEEIAQIGYFGRDDLPEPMSLVARTRIIDALDGITGIFRVIPEMAPHSATQGDDFEIRLPCLNSTVVKSALLGSVPGIVLSFGTAAQLIPNVFQPHWEVRPQKKQIHGADICQVTHPSQICDSADGFYSSAPAIPITVVHADCVPILFARQDGAMIAALHGESRRGSANA